MKTAARELTEKQKRFVAEYVIDLNATQAAIRAGYSPHTANEQGARLLANVSVKDAIAKRSEKIMNKLEITHESVLGELAKLGFSNMADYMKFNEDGTASIDFSAMTREKAAAITEVTVDTYFDREDGDPRAVKRVKFKLADKRAALVDLGRHLQLFTDTTNVNIGAQDTLLAMMGMIDGKSRPLVKSD